MNALKLKIRFWAILFMAVGFSFLFYSLTVNHILEPSVALAADDPPCTNGDCPPTDPPCTNEDCPPDPGCTNEDCPPDYWDDCCCYEEYNEATDRFERICCCRDEQSITCRESYVISYNPPDHGLLQQIAIDTNVCPDNAQQLCAPRLFSIFIGDYWDHLEESCSWWVDLQQWRMEIDIDIKPGSYPNCFNINDHGVIPVAILGSTDFDVTTIDADTLIFAGLEVRVRGNKGPLCHLEDVSGEFTNLEGMPDGYLDLVCQFEDDTSMWSPDFGEAVLTGVLLDGTTIEGSDSICVKPE
jgi:hypothetical protein